MWSLCISNLFFYTFYLTSSIILSFPAPFFYSYSTLFLFPTYFLFYLYYYFSSYFFCFFICLLRLFLFLFLYTLLFLFLSISTFTSLFFKLFKFLNTPLKLFLFLPCFLTYFFNLYHHNQLAFSSNQPSTQLFCLLLTSLENFKWFPLLSLSPLTKWF